MAALSTRERSRLPDSAFAYIDSAGRRRLPIHDEAHVRNALARFGRIEFEDERAKDRARTRLLKAAKKYGIVPIGFIDAQLHPRLPKGTVTLFFADLVESTRLIGELEDRYGPMMTMLRRLIRASVRQNGGYEVDARADEYFAAFSSAAGALRAAIDAQAAIRSASWPDGRRVLVRIGLHTGRPSLTAAGYVGIAVHTVARICNCAAGGQILVSAAARAALADEERVDLRSVGMHRLRGIPDQHELLEVVGEGLVTGVPALQEA